MLLFYCYRGGSEMTKIFSTKLDDKVLRILDHFCRRYHLKKSHILGEIIQEGVQRRIETYELAESLKRGLEQEEQGHMLRAAEVENEVFGKKKRR